MDVTIAVVKSCVSLSKMFFPTLAVTDHTGPLSTISVHVCDRNFIIIAPSIYENDDIKKGILLQLFGGTRKDFQQSGRGSFR